MVTCVQVAYVAGDGEAQSQGVLGELHAELIVLLRVTELETKHNAAYFRPSATLYNVIYSKAAYTSRSPLHTT